MICPERFGGEAGSVPLEMLVARTGTLCLRAKPGRRCVTRTGKKKENQSKRIGSLFVFSLHDR